MENQIITIGDSVINTDDILAVFMRSGKISINISYDELVIILVNDTITSRQCYDKRNYMPYENQKIIDDFNFLKKYNKSTRNIN